MIEARFILSYFRNLEESVLLFILKLEHCKGIVLTCFSGYFT